MQQDVERETRVAISRWRWWETVGVFLVCTLYIASVLPPMVRARKRITFRTILLLRRTEARGDGDGGCSSNADRSHEAPD